MYKFLPTSFYVFLRSLRTSIAGENHEIIATQSNREVITTFPEIFPLKLTCFELYFFGNNKFY